MQKRMMGAVHLGPMQMYPVLRVTDLSPVVTLLSDLSTVALLYVDMIELFVVVRKYICMIVHIILKHDEYLWFSRFWLISWLHRFDI